MVESIAICEKHALPLDQSGGCELCRLSDMPSNAPPARSAWWAVVIPVLILLGVAAWAYGSIGNDPEETGQRGVPPVVPTPEEPAADSKPVEDAPPDGERVAPRVTAPDPAYIPTADDVPQ